MGIKAPWLRYFTVEDGAYCAYFFAFVKMVCSCETLVNSAFNDWKNAIGSDKSRAFQNPPERDGSSGKFSKNELTHWVHKRVLSHAYSAYCDFYKNVSIKTSLFYAIIGAYTCTFSNNLSFVWYFGFWAHSLVGLVTKKSFEWQKKNYQRRLTLWVFLARIKHCWLRRSGRVVVELCCL